jgi:hypothetical protein
MTIHRLNLNELHDELTDLRDKQDLLEGDDMLDDEDQDRLDELEDLAGNLGVEHLDAIQEELIADSDFEKYAEEYAVSSGAIPRAFGWPIDSIDWESAATQLQSDFTSVDFEGETYWYLA